VHEAGRGRDSLKSRGECSADKVIVHTISQSDAMI